jgi:hypothetical protein
VCRVNAVTVTVEGDGVAMSACLQLGQLYQGLDPSTGSARQLCNFSAKCSFLTFWKQP